MSMSWEEFLRDARRLLEVSEEIQDGWALQGDPESFAQLYLAKTELRREGPTLWEYHVLYSSSYGLPTLYLHACSPEGRPLSQEQVWGTTPLLLREGGDIWSTLTQKEHPFLRRPFFQLHPCNSAQLLQRSSSANPLVTWLSCVGPRVGLSLPLVYARLCEENQAPS